ncbi:ATP-binding cassette domain-containing protein [Herbiconiux sp. KACC 21604]|uniref:ABC transporter ATP-binding protein n=1 Tax=unclassified Herbiconiux TaxID=2618217 RepID=UPI001490B53B|nr:ABC transporter ATP-binding protein [Herbiconiux sp. SALV-R1]QJU54805.1 energy-coupling factor ABC transporter ATP-binding protein [Herbiconiux sp. SALV-R1]WPO85920.1 ATP-binding cassette domain-containing protein [Herbiconiux sp. KACC 21604]
MNPRPPAVRVIDVNVRHEGSETPTPAGLSFDVHPGEVVLILGPSGSGKSTLALTLNGLIPHSFPAELEGTVEVAGVATRDTDVARLSEQVSMVFQDPDSQIVTGTVLDEVCFGPENLLLPVGEVLQRAETALRQVGLWERRGENPDRLSGGGRQRLALACALALRAPVIVLDEPTANLDPRGIDEVYAVLGGLVRGGDHALVLVEHNLDAAIELVDRVVVLDRAGRLAFDGPAAEVLRGNVDELLALGVWLPTALLAGLRLRAAGEPIGELPLTPAQLTACLDTLPRASVVGRSADPSGEGTSQATLDSAASRPDRTPAIRVSGLTVSRGRTDIVHGVDLEIDRGEFVAFVGVNGAGKTTLLQAIAGVTPPPRGRIEVLSLDPSRADARELARTIGFVFQNPEHQFITTSVADELAHALELQRLGRAEIDERVDRMLDRFGLAQLRDEHPFLLSGGQKRRLSVGTALIAGAPVLALDEPTFGQDRARATELLTVLDDLNRAGTTVLVVTHDLQLVADHADRVVVMAEGRIVAQGATGEVFTSGALEAAGLQAPPLVRALRATTDARWHRFSRLADLGAGVRS